MQSNLIHFDLGIRAGLFLPMKNGTGEVRNQFFIGIKDHYIAEVSPFREHYAIACDRFIDLKDQIVLPGLINGHTHLAMSLLRGYEDDRSFQEWLYQRIFPIEAELVDAHFVRTGVSLSALECIRFGTTTVNDMYFFPEVTADVLDQAGMRAIVAKPFFDFVTPDEKHMGVNPIPGRAERFRLFHEKYASHPRIRTALGPHAPYTCSDELLGQVLQLSKELRVPIHMHVSETRSEVEESLKKYGKRPVKRLHDLGMLDQNFIAAHLVHLDAEELELFAKSGARAVYNPDSNMKLGSGIASIVEYRKRKILVALGTDGAASNNDLSMFGAMDIGTKLQKVFNQNSTAMTALDALNLATFEGAKALGLGSKVGSIEVGKCADLISVRIDDPHVQPLHSVLSQLVYAYQGLEVDTVICDGKILLEKGIHRSLEPGPIYQDVEKIRQQIRKQG